MIGIDILSIKKIKNKSGSNFLRKVFTENEITYAYSKKNPYQTLAGIFALKEAIIKAYDLKLSYIIKKRIEIVSNNNPIAYLDGNKLNSDLSISHDGEYAIGVCYKKENMISIDNKMKNLLPNRPHQSHKGDYGKIAILGGSPGMAGSCYLTSLACLRAGAGLVYLLVPQSISNILEIKSVEQIIKTIDSNILKYNKNIIKQILSSLEDKDVLAIGPGMGRDESLNKLISEVIDNFNGKIIIDADGLNALSKDLSILKNKKNIILTPHLKEFSRLTGLTINKINEDRVNIAKNFAKEHKVILVLKSENTLVTDGNKLYINEIGNPGMATAGSGDVLTGIISGILHKLEAFDAAKLGVYLHSLAGDLAAEDLCQDSLIARDIIAYLPKAIRLMR
ncbi:NAD(P)H-hydrate dehydratase [Anaerococcus sp. NML200574]|uniref:NAD(P)H-hydrate dehydratase n=1 Tax=Anaerococcus sp. NML200574 TaxID=2954486 RepID=UPI0022386EF7|nr:NAD(P)H-hydrate dehydratase [Anaerococcus sp. NML200574]MCW6677891.1 NAD(P)H-hydrate dehydratase [Anaerococcus sp. NML200574]